MYHPRKVFAATSLIAFCTLPVVLGLYVQQLGLFDPFPVGKKFPSLREFSIDKDAGILRGPSHNKLLLLFFTPECSHCRTEIGHLNELSAKYISDIDIIGVSLDDRQATDALKKELNLKIPIHLADPEKLRNVFKLSILPALFCIDESHTLRRFSIGEHSSAFDEALIREFIVSKTEN